jgi:hypothetical protein
MALKPTYSPLLGVLCAPFVGGKPKRRVIGPPRRTAVLDVWPAERLRIQHNLQAKRNRTVPAREILSGHLSAKILHLLLQRTAR